jgi:hypothetical protein
MANAVLYGFQSLKDVFSDRLTNVRAEAVATAIQASVDEHNRQMNALMGLFAERTTAPSVRFKTAGNHRLQPLDENGRARPVKFFGHYDVAFPIRDAGTAWGANYKALAKMTVEDANRITGEMLKADSVWLRDQMLAALFSSATHTYEDQEFGDLTIQPLANGDTVTYQTVNGGAAAVDTHQLATASAVADATDPVGAIVDELTEHPENGGDVVILIPSNLSGDFAGLTDLEPASDPNIRAGANSDTLVGNLSVPVPGRILGYHREGAWIVEWKALPSNYAIATTTDGAKALRMREEPETQLQGFHMPSERNDHPYYEQQWVRFAGFGAYNRVGAIVHRFGNGTYATPTGYVAPIG